ncbi:MAG: hypothetical protein H0V17_33275 [Deltaproteobacteria bacterium]|nr:hypothetical protein [Deltaproteobacteria bacterium]
MDNTTNRVTTWRNKKTTRTPSQAFDVSDVRRLTTEVLRAARANTANEADASRDAIR